MRDNYVLKVDDLTVGFPSLEEGWTHPVDSVSLEVSAGERVGLVGESGSGKSLTALACLGLVPEPGRILDGSSRAGGIDVRSASLDELHRLRGGIVGLAFQEAAEALNPVYTVGFQIAETVSTHHRVTRREAWNRTVSLLAEVAVDEPETIAAAYPHELSGGQAQRVMLALALAGRPQLLIADEPTSALDVVTQAQVIKLLERLTHEQGLALLLISHDLLVVENAVERVIVMYAGRVIEEGPTDAIFSTPLHPYTEMLLASAPGRRSRLDASIQGPATSFAKPADRGCRFSHRCPIVEPGCRDEEPALQQIGPGRRVRCIVDHGKKLVRNAG
jgi:oligopeptide/dipeptide ABC transporter ATP-binding protein